MSTEAANRARRLLDADWVVTRKWNLLHHANLTDEQAVELDDTASLDGPIRLACGRTAASLGIPGVITRMGAQRCARCCLATGMPPGKGSPKNDPACRGRLDRLRSVPTEETPNGN